MRRLCVVLPYSQSIGADVYRSTRHHATKPWHHPIERIIV